MSPCVPGVRDIPQNRLQDLQPLLGAQLSVPMVKPNGTAKRFGIPLRFDAALAALLREYRDSIIIAFVAYNAGRGRVDKWVAQYGDPRDPGVDPVDWV